MNSLFSKSKLVFWLCLLFSVIVSAGGCKTETKPDSDEAEIEVAIDPPEPMTMVVVGDPNLGPIIQRQWAARRDGVLTIVDLTQNEFVEAEFKLPENTDVVIYPPAMLGELHKREQLMKVPSDIFNSDDFNKNELLRHFRTLVVRQDDQNFGVPLGGPCFSMIANGTLLAQAEAEQPVTWNKVDSCLRKIAKALESNPDLKIPAKIDMPLAKGWAVHSMMARAAPGVADRGKLSTVLDRKSMKPLITQLPFVDALKHLKEVSTKRSLELNPRQVFDLVCKGESVMAIGWPAKGFEDEETEGAIDDEIELQIFSLPGVTERFDASTGNWAKRPQSQVFRVDTIGFSGLMASVSANTVLEDSAWEFLTWLSNKQISLLTMADSPLVGPFRASHLGEVSIWAGDRISEDVSDQYSDVIDANHERAQAMIFPRIPGHIEYLDVLDQAVRRCIAGEQSAEEALQNTAEEWDRITDRIGREEQIQRLKMTRAL